MKNNIIWYNSLSSTNKVLSKLIENSKFDEFYCIATHYQSSGKGQGTNIWHSKANKNLLISVLLYPEYLPVENYFYLTKTVSVAIIQFLKKLTGIEQFKIKWPNDIYFEDKKLAGILIQNEIGHSTFNNCIAGIGLNLNQNKFPDFLPNPVSLNQITGKIYLTESLADELIDEIKWWFGCLRQNQFYEIDNFYQSNLYLLNTLATFTDNQQNKFQGKISSVASDGKLMVEINGLNKYFNFKEIVFK